MTETLKILIGETDHTDLYTRVLQREGYKVEIASTKTEVLNKYIKGNWYAAIIDLRMPNSLEAITELSNIPIVAISGDPSKENLAIEHGASYFLRRPFESIGEIQDSIVNAIANKIRNKKLKAIA
ncbi:MAG: hypothetical protein Q8R00_04675 [Candidatus Nanoarchaeia archaeon]|nr:hypothetical protein [Candidatus Nanoarchaeia archaeon]